MADVQSRSIWRVHVAADGQVLSCRAVERHEARLLAARRARYTAQGLCKCGREGEDKSYSHCARCRERGRVYEERFQARQRGEDVPKLDRRTVLQERKAEERQRHQLEAFEECLKAADRSATLGAIKRWLRAKIEGLRGRKAA